MQKPGAQSLFWHAEIPVFDLSSTGVQAIKTRVRGHGSGLADSRFGQPESSHLAYSPKANSNVLQRLIRTTEAFRSPCETL